MASFSVILVNGQPTASLPVNDRGLLYGDGLFETLAVVAGRPRQWSTHLARLQRGCERLDIPIPEPDTLAEEARRMCTGCERGVLKLILTRGPGGRGYRPPTAPQPTRILALHPWPDYPPHFAHEGIALRLCHTRLARQPSLAGLKHLNRLEQVLARQEWNDEQIPEGLMLDTEGLVIEGTQSNLFLVEGEALITPELSACGVAGVMRQDVMNACAHLGIECRVGAVTLQAVREADALFVCNSLIGIWPVREFDGIAYPASAQIERIREALTTIMEA